MELRRLAVLEDVVESGLGTTAGALAKIRDERLYRLTHGNFETYCHDRFGLGRGYVNRVIATERVAEVLGPIGPKPTESQARELKSLPDQEIRATWQAAAEQAAERGRATPTAADLRAARRGEPEVAPEPDFDDDPADEILDADVIEEPPPPPDPPMRKPRRRTPLIDAFRACASDLRPRIERLGRLRADDRFKRAAEQCSRASRWELVICRDTLNKILDDLPEPVQDRGLADLADLAERRRAQLTRAEAADPCEREPLSDTFAACADVLLAEAVRLNRLRDDDRFGSSADQCALAVQMTLMDCRSVLSVIISDLPLSGAAAAARRPTPIEEIL